MSVSWRDTWGLKSYLKMGRFTIYLYADGNNSIRRGKWMIQMMERRTVVQTPRARRQDGLSQKHSQSSIHRRWREGRMCGEGRLWKFSSDGFHFPSKARIKITYCMRMEEELELSGLRRQYEIALPWQKEEFSTF